MNSAGPAARDAGPAPPPTQRDPPVPASDLSLAVPGVFRTDDVVYARTSGGTYLRATPTPDAPEDWAFRAVQAADRHAEAGQRERIPAAPGPIILRDCTEIDPAVSPTTHLEEILTHRGCTVHRQQAPDSQDAPAMEQHDGARPLLVTIRTTPPITTPPITAAPETGASASDATGAGQSATLEHQDLLDIHAEGAQWFLHPLRLTSCDPAPEQVLRRRLAATPAHHALASWWRLAADTWPDDSEDRLLHRVHHELSATGAAVVAWHAAQIIDAWSQGRDSSRTTGLRRRLTIVDAHAMAVTRHPVLPHPIPHGRAPEGLGG